MNKFHTSCWIITSLLWITNNILFRKDYLQALTWVLLILVLVGDFNNNKNQGGKTT